MNIQHKFLVLGHNLSEDDVQALQEICKEFQESQNKKSVKYLHISLGLLLEKYKVAVDDLFPELAGSVSYILLK